MTKIEKQLLESLASCKFAAKELEEAFIQGWTKRGELTEPKREGLVEYAEFVSMKASEYAKLVSEHGDKDALRLVEILNNYKGSSGKRYKNDYMAIKSWVIERLYQEKLRSGERNYINTKDIYKC